LSNDLQFMKLALRLAGYGLGNTWPNPSVGAVVVADRTVVGRGWTQISGRPHAETVALDEAGKLAQGATLYVTLEPCSHHGKSPPCVDAIIDANISRVVCGIEDPDPRVGGKGLERLRRCGIQVESGLMAEEAAFITAGHILRITENRPFVQLKLALGSDGMIPAGADGAPVWVSGQLARDHAHLLRAKADAILTGAGTVIVDNPYLNCRLPGLCDASPVRVIVSSNGKLPANANVFNVDVPVLLACLTSATPEPPTGIDVIKVAADKTGRVNLSDILQKLAERGITRLLVEAGPQIANSFIKLGLVDELILFAGHLPAGSNGLSPPAIPLNYTLATERKIGKDIMRCYRKIGV
jgi:diaminohydroxyphosphoribosylaminopyrimidine deaminase/5-amino-6-(5-phosphoribosylamino)uracil reductase